MDNQQKNLLILIQSLMTGKDPIVKEPDWEVIYQLSLHQTIEPLIYDQISSTSLVDSIPHELLEKYKYTAITSIIAQVRRTEQFLRVYHLLLEAGIKVIVLKGLICRMHYPKPNLRSSCDEDVWIQKEDFNACDTLLLELGFTRRDISTYAGIEEVQEISYSHVNGLCIEVHLNLFGTDNQTRKDMNKYFNHAFEQSIEIKVDKYTMYTLSHTDHMLFLMLHFFKHLLCAGVGIRQAMDILLYGKANEKDIKWERIERVLKEIHAFYVMEAVWDMGSRYFGINVSGFGKISSDNLVEELLMSGTFGNADNDRLVSQSITLAATRDLINQDTKSYLAKAVFPSYSYMVVRYPILKKYVLLLPFYWIKRMFGHRKPTKWKSKKIGMNRVKLFKEYRIIVEKE